MSDKFVKLSERFWVSPQIVAGDLAAAKAMGVGLVINNRPEGEEPSQPAGAEIEQAARALGLSYVAIPIGPRGISPADLDAFDAAVGAHDGAVLAYCRSGTRSAILRALAGARAGRSVDDLLREAADAGYNLEGQRPALEKARR